MKKKNPILALVKTMGNFPALFTAILANLGEGACSVAIAAQLGFMVDSLSAGNRQALYLHGIILLVSALGIGISIYCKDTLLGMFLEKGMGNVRKRTISAIGFSEFSWLGKKHTGELTARVSNDLNTLLGSLRPVVILGVSQFLIQFVAVGYLLYLDWLLTLIIFGLVPFTILLQWVMSRVIKGYQAKSLAAVSDLTKAAADSFGQFETVKSLSLEREMYARFEVAQDVQVDAEQKASKAKAILSPVGQLSRLIPMGMLLGIGGLFAIHGRMSLGLLVIFLSLSGSAASILGSIAPLVASIRRLEACAERTLELWNVPLEAQGGPPALNSPAFPALEFKRVSFAYEGNGREGSPASKGVLKDLSFSIGQGERVAVVGVSGCGKSTLLSLAATLYHPDEGEIFQSGSALGNVDLSSLRSKIGYIPQDPVLFTGSVYENITCFARDGDRERARACLRQVDMLSYLEGTQKGIDMEVGDRGLHLSGGQRQRIAIARALYKETPLLLMDEITSALDLETERSILDALFSLEHRPAMVYVTHRLEVLAPFDRILVIEGGRIVQEGAFAALSSSPGLFSSLLRQQGDETGPGRGEEGWAYA